MAPVQRGPQVARLRDEAVPPHRPGSAAQTLVGLLGQLPVIRPVAGTHGVGFAGFGEPVPAVLPQRLELAEPGLAFVTGGVVPNADTKFYFVGIDKARFRKPVEPGDQLILTAQLTRSFKGIWRFSSAAFVGTTEVASADMMVAPEVAKPQPAP